MTVRPFFYAGPAVAASLSFPTQGCPVARHGSRRDAVGLQPRLQAGPSLCPRVPAMWWRLSMPYPMADSLVLNVLVRFPTVGREADGKSVIFAGGLSHEHRGC